MNGSRTAVKWREGELEMEVEGEMEVEVEGELGVEVEFNRRSEEGREGMSAMNTSRCE